MTDWTPDKGPIRAVVVDDSTTARELLVAVLQDTEGIEVVGVGNDGEDAVRLAQRMRPDVLLIDVDMPVLDGLEATQRIMQENPIPIVLVTGTLMHTDVTLGFKALQAGALTVLSKPGMMDVEACAELVRTVRSMGRVPVVRRWARSQPQVQRPPIPPTAPTRVSVPLVIRGSLEERISACTVVGIAASTGGPAALARLLEGLPADYPVPIFVVQHVTRGFAPGLADWLDSTTKLHVSLASHGDEPRPGTVLVAPDDYHLGFNARHQVELSKAPPYLGMRPSANHLFEALAHTHGASALGIILTGMGDDGAEGMISLHAAGGVTIAQDKQSCVVYGMPREAVQRGAIDIELPIEEIAMLLRGKARARVRG